MSKYKIALAKGELGPDIEVYMRSLGSDVQVIGKRYVQENGNVTYRIIRPRDVARFVGDRYDFGITGKDCWVEAGSRSDLLLDLPFGVGKVVLYGKAGTDYKNLEGPRFVSSDYPNITRRLMKRLSYPDSNFDLVDGSDEGYVAAGENNLGVGCVFSGNTLEENGLVVLDELMTTCGVLIARSGLTLNDFYRVVKGGRNG